MLTIHNLNKVYPDGTHALNNINLSLPSGMVGLLGPNGAGKSSLMRTLACLQRPDQGEIRFNNLDSKTQAQQIRQQLGYLPQYFGVYPNMSCRALLHYMAELKGVEKQQQKAQIDNLLQLTNLTAVANKKVANFSGGMRQRFGIAQALLGAPKLIIMDEPTAGLDPVERERLHRVLVNISQQKLVLLSTHIVEDIENLCSHVALMNKGKIIESTAIQQVINPLKGKVWQSQQSPSSEDTVLSASYKFGQPIYRLYAEQQPSTTAYAVDPTLQDRYFLMLQEENL